MMSLDRLPQYQVKTPYFAVVVAVFKYEQDKKREYSAQGAYIDVRDQIKTQV